MGQVEQDWTHRTGIVGKETLAPWSLWVSFLGSWVGKALKRLLSMRNVQFLLDNDKGDTC